VACSATPLAASRFTAICLTAADAPRLASRSLSRFFPSRSYGVVTRRGRAPSAQARAFIELVKQAG
jgi:hypothetical protein